MLCLLSSGFVLRARRGHAATFQPPSLIFPQSQQWFGQSILEPLDKLGATKQFTLLATNNNNFKILL
jgi:hypothetical protein